MIKSFYEEPIFSGDFKREDLQEIDTLIQKLLRLNNGVGVVGGFYAPGLPVCIISELALQSLGYNSDEVFGTGYTMQFADRFAKDSPLREVWRASAISATSKPRACAPCAATRGGSSSARRTKPSATAIPSGL